MSGRMPSEANKINLSAVGLVAGACGAEGGAASVRLDAKGANTNISAVAHDKAGCKNLLDIAFPFKLNG
jgi:hypothetical protein